MLAYIPALAVGLGSLGIYLTAFFFPEIHRKNDFICGLGLFYSSLMGKCWTNYWSVLLGSSGVALLGWVTQTLSLRRQLTHVSSKQSYLALRRSKNTVEEKVSKLSLTQRLSQLQQRGGSITGAKDRVRDCEQNGTNYPTSTTSTAAPTAATGEAMPAGTTTLPRPHQRKIKSPDC